ncbi:hypothetical protein [Acinetobacter sp. A47]|uniref:hypothetical protein n=1 Tax=Acinetobacter sp. A47 TaxID=1561217 RepID=UPI000571E01D|nr:hypothetical protein [Acinetobacter sp. A47]
MAKSHRYFCVASSDAGTHHTLVLERKFPYVSAAAINMISDVFLQDAKRVNPNATTITLDSINYLGEMTEEEWLADDTQLAK